MAKKRRGGAKRGAGRSTKRAYTVITNPAPAPNPKRRRRRNPSAIGGATRGFLGPIEPAIRAAIPGLIGAMAGKLAQRRWGNGAAENENWTWKDYAFGSLGVLGAQLAAKHLFRASAQTQQQIMTGGLLLMGFKLLTNEIIPMSATAHKWLGEDGEEYLPGDTYATAMGEAFVLGSDGQWRPADSSDRLLGDTLSPPGRLGDVLSPPGRLGQDEEIETAPTPIRATGNAWKNRDGGMIW